MSVTSRIDGFQQRHRAVGFPIAVVYKFYDDQGSYLAALITYYGFLSIVPLVLLATSLLGFLLQSDPGREQQILETALQQFPVIGSQLSGPSGLSGSGVAIVIGAVGALYGALGVAQAAQNAMNTAWAVPRNRRPDPFTSRLRSGLLLLTAGLAILATTVLSVLGGSLTSMGGVLETTLRWVVILVGLALNALVFTFAFRLLTATGLTVRDVAPGAIAAAVVWQLLQTAGVAYVNSVVRTAGETNGVFALVLGLMAWIYVGAVALVLCVEVNAVRAKQLYPRSLLTPFTDSVDLTKADVRAYTEYATAQQNKGFQSVDVDFEHDGQNATFQRRSRKS
ncbi:MAG: YihY/virulence factor BrkB family protein [Geodermatophilaceae bacterium]|nr:YihY/virulence factor BrkB family protein [Geodermatophilaceae bacterium]